MNKIKQTASILVLILLVITLAVNIRTSLKNAELNRRYEESIQRLEKSTENYIRYLEETKVQLQSRIDKKG